MGSSTKDNEIAIKYADELVSLKVNSKPLINSLTMMAEDYIKQSPIIVGTIEKHLSKVRNDAKLPVLYLIDSIIKNVKRDYVPLFSHNIVSTFCGVFERADEKTRMQMWKLRQTWTEIFPTNKLYQIDVKARSMDPGWPIAKLPSSSIHVNPKFLQNKMKPSSESPSTSPKSSETEDSSSTNAILDDDEVRMREELLIKQKELIVLQQKKLELELLQTQARLAEQARLKALKGKNREDKDKLLKQAEVAKQRTSMATSIIAKASETKPDQPQKQPKAAPRLPSLTDVSNHSTSSSTTTSATLTSSSSLKTESGVTNAIEYAADPRMNRARVSHVKGGARRDQSSSKAQTKEEQKSPKSKKSSTRDSSSDSKEKVKEPQPSKSDSDEKKSKSKSDSESSKDKDSWKKSHRSDSSDRSSKERSSSREKSRSKSESRSPEKGHRSSREPSGSDSTHSTSPGEGDSKFDRMETDSCKSPPRKMRIGEDRESLDNRRTAVLSKTYRKRSEPPPELHETKAESVRETVKEPTLSGDTDLRIGSLLDIDFRTGQEGPEDHMHRNPHMQPRAPRGRHPHPPHPTHPLPRDPRESREPRGRSQPQRGRGFRRGFPERRGPGVGNRNGMFPPNFPDMNQHQNFPIWNQGPPGPGPGPGPGWFPPMDEPGAKKPRRSPWIQDLFGQQDVDLRQVEVALSSNSNWAQMKSPSPWQEAIEAELRARAQAAQVHGHDVKGEMSERPPAQDIHSAQIHGADSNEGSQGSSAVVEPSSLNVQDLLSKLLSAGLLRQPTVAKTEPDNSDRQTDAKDEVSKDKDLAMDTSDDKEEATMQEKRVEAVTPVTGPPPLEVVDITFNDNLRERRAKLVNQICVGVQCASCGLRFPPDQSLRYTQHLDWHFRLNRREKSHSRKAQSRRWYYDLSDWIQFEEIEDLEERAASLFEFQEPEKADGGVAETRTLLNPDAYTVLASEFEGASCPQCGEGFETFYDSEEDEWRLRDALAQQDSDGELRLFHPICHEDYLTSLAKQACETTEESSATEGDESSENLKPVPIPMELDVTDSKQDDDDEVLILKEGKKEVVLMEIALEEDDPIVHSDTEGKSNEIEKITKDNENETEKNNDLNSNNVNNNNSKAVLSPIVIQVEDDSIIPGITTRQGDVGGVFDFALSSSNQQQQDGKEHELPLITYNSMQFDFPKIKVEPPEWDQLDENQVIMSKEFLVDENQTPMDITLDDDSPPPTSTVQLELDDESRTSRNVDIDLTADDEDNSQSLPSNSLVSAIDGNLEMRSEARSPLPTVPKKIRINISGAEKPSESQSPSHPASSQEDVSPNTTTPDTNTDTNKLDDNSDDHNEKMLEEIKRFKPRLVGKKLVNCPPKKTGKEESGLCVIS